MEAVEGKKKARWILIPLALLFGIAGLFFAIGGVMLLLRGGSAYYGACGIALLVVAWGLLRDRIFVGPLYSGIFTVTLVWAYWEAGSDFWPLFSRIYIFVVAGALLSFALPSSRINAGARPMTMVHMVVGSLLAMAAIGLFMAMFADRGTYNFAAPTAKYPVTRQTEQTDWSSYGNNPQAERFVALDQINRGNVGRLKVAWTYRHGDIPVSPNARGYEDQGTPLQIGNSLYFCTPKNNIVSVDATTGRQRWKALLGSTNKMYVRCRGIAYHDGSKQDPDSAEGSRNPQSADSRVADPSTCVRRILTANSSNGLIAIDADTGKFCLDFGTNGHVDLRHGMGTTPDKDHHPNSAPTLARDLVVVGGYVNDNLNVDISSGVVRAYDVRTGELRWAWDAGNPAVTGPSTAQMPYTPGSPNVWSYITYDPSTDLLFLPVGNNSPDLWGGNRDANRDRYSSSVVALRARDGRPVWSYQTVHHDLWDYDMTQPPVLTSFPKDGRLVPAVVFATKSGMFFALDRATGKPLTRVEERPVPAGHLKGEHYAPTQPFSVGLPMLGHPELSEKNMWGMTPFDQLWCRLQFKTVRPNPQLYDPPGLDRQLVLPGSVGGFNWGGISVDKTGHTFFANDLRIGLLLRLAERNTGGHPVPENVKLPMQGTPYYVAEKTPRFLSPLGIPCQEPPFGTISAIDMNTRKVAWSVPAGTTEDVRIFGIRVTLPIPLGLPSIGPSLATQGGLLFLASTLDHYIRAFDSATGKELWKSRLPVGSQGGPISYKSVITGEQFIVISAGGSRDGDATGTNERGDYLIAFKLED